MANRVQHPRNVYVREDRVIPLVNGWLTKIFSKHHIQQTVTDLFGTQELNGASPDVLKAQAKVRDCNTKINRLRNAIEAGGDPVMIGPWITEAGADLASATAVLDFAEAAQVDQMTVDEIEQIMTALGSFAALLEAAGATPEQCSMVYEAMGLFVTYHPGKHEIRIEVNLDPDVLARGPDSYPWGNCWCPRGDLNPHAP
ncbi:MAG: hypothetical protein ABIS86_22510 [Streptosporangiaceae bacterium]